MSAMGGNGHLRSLFDRWERLEADKAAVTGDLKELFAEAKGAGYNTKALRIAFRAKARTSEEADKDREIEAEVDLYLAVLGEPRARSAPARVEIIEEIPPHDPETGEVIIDAPESSNHDVSVGDEPSPEAGPQAEASPVGTDGGTLAGHEGDREGEAASAGLPTISSSEKTSCPQREPDMAKAGEQQRNTTGVTAGETAPIQRKPYVLRPHCLHPDMCGGSGSTHCHSCAKEAGLAA